MGIFKHSSAADSKTRWCIETCNFPAIKRWTKIEQNWDGDIQWMTKLFARIDKQLVGKTTQIEFFGNCTKLAVLTIKAYIGDSKIFQQK